MQAERLAMARAVTSGAALFVLLAGAAAARDVFLQGGRLVDPRTRQISEENLLILDGVVAGRPASPPPGFAGEVIDVTGKWVIPGLHDLHVHAGASRGLEWNERMGNQIAARRFLYAGVTGVLDLLGYEPFVLTMRDRLRAKPVPDGADLFAAGPIFTGPRRRSEFFGGPSRVIDSPERARRQIRDLARKKPDAIKLIYEHAAERSWRPTLPTFSPETLAAAIEVSHELGIPTVVHVRTWPDVRDAARAGARSITHLPSETVVPPDIVEILAAQGTRLIPTLAVANPLLWNEPQVLDDPLFVVLNDPEMLETYRRWRRESEEPRYVAALNRVEPIRFESLRRLHAAGVPILSGSDSGNARTIHGYALHHELSLLVEAGLDPFDVLAGSTHLAGELLGRSWGLAEGDEGSVVVLDASPIEDIRNTRRIAEVVHHGIRFDREALAERMHAWRWTPDLAVAVAVSAGYLALHLPWWLWFAVLTLAAVLFGPLLLRLAAHLRLGAPEEARSRSGA